MFVQFVSAYSISSYLWGLGTGDIRKYAKTANTQPAQSKTIIDLDSSKTIPVVLYI